MSRTLQFRRYNSATIANTTGANGELIINTTNHTITVHDGTTPGGFATLNSQTDNNIDQFARNTANTATSNITILQGVNATQNTNITTVNSVAQNAYNKANAAYDFANTIVSDTQIDPFARQTANAAFDKANVANDLAQSAYNYANTISATGIDQYARDTANNSQAVNETQNTNITFATTLAQNAYNNSNTKFSSSGGQITGNVIIVGDLDVTDNTVVTNAVEANNVIIDGSLKTGLAARTSVVLPHLIAQFASNSATYVQTNSQNINPEGSADWVVTADNGTDTDYYLDLGLHGSQAYDKILTPYDGYLFVQGSTIGQAGGNLVIGTTSSFAGLETMFVAGGYESNNRVMRIGTYGANIIGDLTVTGNIIGPTINAISGGGVTGNINVTATDSQINFVANSSGDGYGLSTLELVPDTNATQDQYIVIDPTAPSHIHIRAGGQQDASQAQLFLGGEKNYVRITDNQGLRLQNEYTTSNYNYYTENSQYVSGSWFEESGNYFVRFTTDDVSMIADVTAFGYGSLLNQITIEWYDGVGTVSNTMMSVSGYWYGVGNVYTAQVNSTLPANNTVLTAIAFEIFTTQTNYVEIQNNDFTVDVKDDVRISGRDVVTIRNWSTSNPVTIVSDYDNSDYTWEFGADGNLTTPGDVTVSGDVTGTSGASTLYVKAQPAGNTYIQLNENVDSVIGTMASLVIRTDIANADHQWSFGVYGDFDLPGNLTNATACSAINFVPNSSGDGNGYSTIELRPDTNLSGTDQYLIIDPTAPGHIHIRAGGIQDDSSADLIVGGENSHLKVSAGANSSVSIRANSHQFIFGEFGYGVLRFPNITYADLPQSPDIIAGQRALINDANLEAIGNFGQIVGGGGANTVPVWTDGTDWRIG
jgi:hypothetical protein